jgi:NADPH-dependent ferric siderophore reductase
VVTDDPGEALAAAASGGRVVLILAPGAPVTPAQPARMAVLVGDPADPAVRAAASEMEAELFPSPP